MIYRNIVIGTTIMKFVQITNLKKIIVWLKSVVWKLLYFFKYVSTCHYQSELSSFVHGKSCFNTISNPVCFFDKLYVLFSTYENCSGLSDFNKLPLTILKRMSDGRLQNYEATKISTFQCLINIWGLLLSAKCKFLRQFSSTFSNSFR